MFDNHIRYEVFGCGLYGLILLLCSGKRGVNAILYMRAACLRGGGARPMCLLQRVGQVINRKCSQTDTRAMASQSDASVGLTAQLPDFKQSHQAEALPKICVSTRTLKLIYMG